MSADLLALPLNMQTKIRLEPCDVLPPHPWCWTWTAAVTSSGYGCVGHEGRTKSTHKLAYVLLIGPVPEGLQLDHVCLNKLCCNPAHLEPVTGLENIRRSLAVRFPVPPLAPRNNALMEIFERHFGPLRRCEPAS